jgi:8-oxo-dGTP diphosphatase
MPKATVAAIVTTIHDGIVSLLLTRRANEPFMGQWCLPGGHIEVNETAMHAIIREVKEETGLNFDAHFFGSFDEILPGQSEHAVVSVYKGEATGEMKLQPDEVTEIRWFTLSEALSMPLAFTHHQILDTYVSSLNQFVNEPRSGMLEEYTALRGEILGRVDLRQQILLSALVIAGTLLTLGVESKQSLVMLIFPILAVLLVLVWVQSDVRAGEIGEYIKDNVEARLAGVRWETHIRQNYINQKIRLAELSAFGVFLVTQIFAVLLAIPMLTYSIQEIVLLALDAISMVLTFFFIQRRKTMLYSKKNKH